jgi:pyrroline-5-carboxylate reductase
MNNTNIGFIGAGNMAQAMFRRWISIGIVPPEKIRIYDVNQETARKLHVELSVRVAASYDELISVSDIIVLAIKPKHASEVLSEISGKTNGKVVLSIVTGLTSARMNDMLPNTQCARIMPNTPAMVGEGVFAVSTAHTLSEENLALTNPLLACLGRVHMVGETDFAAVTGVSGSGPAYAFVMIEAMADAGVRMGLARQTAYELAAQTLVGAGRMVLESGKNPAALKDAVCSPGGTTIEAIYQLEKNGFRAAVMDAVSECTRKAQIL